MLVANLVRQMNRARCVPEIACLKDAGVLGEQLSCEVPVHANLIRGKYDVGVIWRLNRLFRKRQIDCLITVGAGDKLFWGRLAAKTVPVPVVLSALHSTGWPDGIGRLNRLLTPITDGFIAVAQSHAQYLRDEEGLPEKKIFVIRNGVDTDRFVFDEMVRQRIRRELQITSNAPVVAIIAALRPEKDHQLFLESARRLHSTLNNAHFLIVGDGPRRTDLERQTRQLGLGHRIHFLGSRSDIPELLSAVDVFALTSKNEASPVSILEAMACSRPVVAPAVGSIAESVADGLTGVLFSNRSPEAIAEIWLDLLSHPGRAEDMGNAGRKKVVSTGSLKSMTNAYERLLRKTRKNKDRHS